MVVMVVMVVMVILVMQTTYNDKSSGSPARPSGCLAAAKSFD